MKRFVLRSIFVGAIVLGILFASYLFYFQKKQCICVTVFVHGTVGCSLSLLNPVHCIYDSADDETLSVRASKKYRQRKEIQYDQIMGEEGFHPFFPISMAKGQAAGFIIAAYDAVSHFIGYDCDKDLYVVFGWSGLLSQKARKLEGEAFYDALCDYRDAIRKQHGVDPEIRIIAHSHGGNVALWLGEVEQKKQRNLVVSLLCMLGTPMQKETADLIGSQVFRSIILAYSLGDNVQTSDYFSTAERQSFMTMHDVFDCAAFIKAHPGFMRADMQCIVNDNPYGVDHTNMWLAGRSQPVLDIMDPLPFVTVLPLFLNELNPQEQCIDYEARLNGSLNGCACALLACSEPRGEQETVVENNSEQCKKLSNLLFFWRNKLLAEWRSDDDIARHPLFNTKNLTALWNALFV